MYLGSEQPSERLDAEAAVQATRTMAARMKLIQQAKTRFHWSDCIYAAMAVMWFFFAYQALQDLEAYTTNEMARLTLLHRLSPAIDFALGWMSLTQIFISAAFRRLDALTQLIGGAEKT